MQDTTLFVGMDVHKDTISISVVDDQGNRVRPTVTLANDPVQLRRWFGRLEKEGKPRGCYEAGSCGYEVQRLLAKMGIACDVIAPALIPVRPGDQVKTAKRRRWTTRCGDRATAPGTAALTDRGWSSHCS
jgi:transposase